MDGVWELEPGNPERDYIQSRFMVMWYHMVTVDSPPNRISMLCQVMSHAQEKNFVLPILGMTLWFCYFPILIPNIGFVEQSLTSGNILNPIYFPACVYAFPTSIRTGILCTNYNHGIADPNNVRSISNTGNYVGGRFPILHFSQYYRHPCIPTLYCYWSQDWML